MVSQAKLELTVDLQPPEHELRAAAKWFSAKARMILEICILSCGMLARKGSCFYCGPWSFVVCSLEWREKKELLTYDDSRHAVSEVCGRASWIRLVMVEGI